MLAYACGTGKQSLDRSNASPRTTCDNVLLCETYDGFHLQDCSALVSSSHILCTSWIGAEWSTVLSTDVVEAQSEFVH